MLGVDGVEAAMVCAETGEITAHGPVNRAAKTTAYELFMCGILSGVALKNGGSAIARDQQHLEGIFAAAVLGTIHAG